MSQRSPCKRKEFISKLRRMGFSGPFSGTKHQFMVFHHCRLAIPSYDEYSVPQLHMMIKEVEEIISRKISIEEWNNL